MMTRLSPTDLLPLKPLEFSILLALTEGNLHGYGIVKRIAERDVGAVALAPGNLYVVLDRLMAAGLIDERRPRRQGNARRRYYGITPFGRQVVANEAARIADVMRTVRRLEILPTGGAGR